MYKILITLGVATILFIFSMQNAEHVPVSFVFGRSLNIRLCFLVLLAGGGGFLAGHFIGLATEIKLKRQIRRLIHLSHLAPNPQQFNQLKGRNHEL